MKTKGWIFLFAGVLALCAGLLLLRPPTGDVVEIRQDGVLRYRFVPETMAEPQEVELFYAAGKTVVHVGADGVYVRSADCRNQNCVQHGPLRPGGLPIVCLPERIVVRWAHGSGVDAVSG